MESEIDYVEIHDANTVSVDEVHIDDTKKMTIVTYQQDGKVDSVDIQ
jgi:archaellum component FlaF (FlaF/FlaG flagellin family)